MHLRLKMATRYGLSLAAAVVCEKYTRSSLKKDLNKDSLIDLIMSWSAVTRLSKGGSSFISDVAFVASASPSKGGGVEAAVSAVKDDKLTEAVDYVKQRIDPSPHPTLLEQPQGQGDIVDQPLAVDGDDTTSAGAGTAVVAAAPGDPVVKLTNPHDGESTGPICKSYWKGSRCEKPETCERRHPPICTATRCPKGGWRSCPQFHLISKGKGGERKAKKEPTRTKPNQGNGKGGRRPHSPTLGDFMALVRAVTPQQQLLPPPPTPPAPPQAYSAWPPLPMPVQVSSPSQVPFQASQRVSPPPPVTSDPGRQDLSSLQGELERIAKVVQDLGARLGTALAQS